METTNTAKEKKDFLIDEDELDLLYENLDKIFIQIARLHGFTQMMKQLEQFKDKKGKIDFDYIETYVRKKAYEVRKQKDNIFHIVNRLRLLLGFSSRSVLSFALLRLCSLRTSPPGLCPSENPLDEPVR